MNKRLLAFTLVELLLALSIFSVAALCVYGTFWAGVKLNQRSEGENAAYQQIRLTLELMSRELENAIFYDFTNSYPGKTAFAGEEDAVIFFLATGEGLKAVRYSLDPPEDGKVHKVIVGARHDRNVSTIVDLQEREVGIRELVREEWDLPGYFSGVADERRTKEVIASNIGENSLEFSYGYSLDQAAGTYEWRRAWAENSLPFLVRVKMDFMLAGPAPRMITMHKDVLIPQGSLGKGPI